MIQPIFPPLPEREALKIFFYECPPHIQSINLYPHLFPHNFYFANLIRFLKRYEVTNPLDADLFFVPANLIKFQFSKSFPDPAAYIEKLPYLGKKPHLLFAGGDFPQRKPLPYENKNPDRAYKEVYKWLDERFILIAFESTDDLLPQDVGFFPYVLKDERCLIPAFNKGLFKKEPTQMRDLRFSFVGAMVHGDLPKDHIRGGMLYGLVKKRKEYFVGTMKEAILRYGKREGHHIRMFERSKFVLCPAGFGRWTFRLGEAIFYGAIPVLLSDGYKLPFSSYIPWEGFCFRPFEKDLLDIPQKLKFVTETQMSLYLYNLAKNAHYFTEDSMHHLLALELVKRIEGASKKLSDRCTSMSLQGLQRINIAKQAAFLKT